MNIEYYQTIPELNIRGRMNTPEEFDKIGLPNDLQNKHVLDIGCNSGAFLYECRKRNAVVCHGVEVNNNWRYLAWGILNDNPLYWDKCNVIITGDLDNVLGNYDLVLLLSVLHVCEEDPQDLLNKALEKLKSGGLLIVEINDRLQNKPINLPSNAKFYGKNKDDRSVYHVIKDN